MAQSHLLKAVLAIMEGDARFIGQTTKPEIMDGQLSDRLRGHLEQMARSDAEERDFQRRWGSLLQSLATHPWRG